MGALCGLIAITATAQTTQVPFEFQPGTPASAAQVNANFGALEAAVDDTARAIADLRLQVQALQAAASGGLSIFVAGARVGAFVTGGPDDPNFGFDTALLAVSDQGYFFGVSRGEGPVGEDPPTSPEGALATSAIFYTQPNCLGTPYLAFPYGDFTFMWRQGFVVAAVNPNDVVKAYRVKGTPAALSMYSVKERTSAAAATCSNLQVAEVKRALPLVSNDPSVTGVQNEFAGPLQIRPR